MTILFPLEIKNREFHSKIFLASKILEKTKFDVVIGEKNKVYNLFKNNKNVYLLSKGGPRPGFRFEKTKFRNNYIGILDEEGPILNLDIDEKKTRLHNYILKNIDDYFLWGEKDLNSNKHFFRKYKSKLKLFGHPKFDILKKNQIKFYKKEITNLKKKYKKFIFVSSSFPVDQIMKTKLFNKFRFHNFEMGKKKTIIKKKFEVYLEKEKKNYISLIDLLKKFSIDNPDVQIIFRPHPRQNIVLVKKRFGKKFPNIKVIYKGVITPWIAACELYIHSGCTSFLEAASLNKKVICFIKNNHSKKAKMFKEYGVYFSNFKRCIDFMNNSINKKNFFIKKTKKPLTIIHNSFEKNFFFICFINFIKKKYDKKLSPIQNYYKEESKYYNFFSSLKISVKKLFLYVPLLIDLLFLFKPSHILTYDYKKKKFPHLFKKEIKKYLYLPSKLKNKIKILQISKDLFLLSRNF